MKIVIQLLAKEDDEIIACASCFRREYKMPLLNWQEDFINVIDVFKDDNKKKGIGTLLVNKIKVIAKEKGSYQVCAYSDISNYGVYAFWLKNNFVIMPVKDNVNDNVLGCLVGYKI